MRGLMGRRGRGLRRSGLLLTAALAALSACRADAPSSFAGFVDAPLSAVATQVAGRVDAIAVQEGDRVTKGQLLVQLDARERVAQLAQVRAAYEQARVALREAQANLDASLPTVKGAGAEIARAQATLDEAERNDQRTEELAAGAAATPQQVDASRARLREAQATLESLTSNRAVAQGRVGALVVAVSNARAAVQSAAAAVRLAEVQLSEAQVLAPFDGLVVSRNLEVGEWAAPGTAVVTVEDLSRLWIRLDVEETGIEKVRVGEPAQVRVLALPDRTLRGRVIEVGAEGDFAVNRDVKRGRPDVRTFRVRVLVEDPPPELRPGMTSEVTFSGARPNPAPAPRDAAR